jgi:hypothetical protein
VKDQSGLQPFDMISVTETQADGLGWYNGAPSALVQVTQDDDIGGGWFSTVP